MNILYLGSFATKDIISKYPNVGIDIYKVSEFLVKGFKEKEGINLKVITSPDLPKYPIINELYINHRIVDDVELVSSLNLAVIRQVWTIFSMFFACSRIVRKYKERTYLIIPYMMFRHVIASRMLKLIYRNKIHICTIVPDVFFYEKKQWLNYYSNKLTEYLAKKSDSFVLYTETMADYLSINKKPFVVMEGCIDPAINDDFAKLDNGDKKSIVYTGSLYKKYGICRLVDAMQYINESNVELLLYGSGDAVEYIKEACVKDKRIKYMGLVSKNDTIVIQNSASVLVNPRNSDDGEFTKYSCPSKILEYMLTGNPTVICRLPGIPEEYYDYLIVAKDNSIQSLAESLNLALRLSDSERNKYKKARSFVISRTGYGQCCNRILNLWKN